MQNKLSSREVVQEIEKLVKENNVKVVGRFEFPDGASCNFENGVNICESMGLIEILRLEKRLQWEEIVKRAKQSVITAPQLSIKNLRV